MKVSELKYILNQCGDDFELKFKEEVERPENTCSTWPGRFFENKTICFTDIGFSDKVVLFEVEDE